jgi:Papain-like cysteine protease AvrRpt2
MATRRSVARSSGRPRRKAAPVGGLVAPRDVSISGIIHSLTRRRCLCFTMQYQEQTQWCWSATATSIAHYYNATSIWTQCSLVNEELGRSDCCTNPSSGDCNKPWMLDTVLTRVGHLASFVGGSTSFAGVCTELDNGRPLGVRIGWSGGGGHFNVIGCYTYSPLGMQSLQIEDPFYGTSVWDYDTFRTAYQGSGSWTHSYKTNA